MGSRIHPIYVDGPAVPEDPSVPEPVDVAVVVKRTLVAAYLELGEWLEGGAGETVLKMAAAVEAMDGTEDCCPVCEETTCDERCPLEPVRNGS